MVKNNNETIALNTAIFKKFTVNTKIGKGENPIIPIKSLIYFPRNSPFENLAKIFMAVIIVGIIENPYTTTIINM